MLPVHFAATFHSKALQLGGMGLTLFAIFFGRIAAVQAKMWIQRETEKRNRKLEIFKTLMRTRGNPLSPEHVFALNTIILEFPGKTEPDTIIRKK